ncbi:TetR/AcrR family transcriptional regulator [Dietzia maris]|jgi:AcrR family transcriptional regulator|uniref:TetR/AcrR family transcriptional regulator n=1 Tax=Dietzia maris TaxID=37915 RepID=A0A365PD49_9ACTN|nr:TetR/AcrR family transcriptional regulator [Dietzia maris]MBB0990826.1 TetR/AcrR family transcriptional regulator [Dietzia sp. SLG510A3-30A2]MBB0993925.1 TetR/AcrR family transcriptional regulator [Dietzia sp. SLG510A3-40A3]MBB1008260.1 TetR/AcrR family transcriptional regulator [Dietzia sp. SLG510A3-3B2-2]MDN4506946.1 TetR/AcrR family transcriptional regulator [Dietzia maris]RBA38851.1 TetR/AcrR family transcriptional regulator [Dietzia maris]
MTTSGGRRLSKHERRSQLIVLGIRLLETVPFHALSLDDVAERAGVSRSLLFHYFPTKLDYLTAVVRAAADHVLSLTEIPVGAHAEDSTRAIITALVRYIQRRRDNYVAVLRSGRAVDPALEKVVDGMHRTISLRILDSLGVHAPDPLALALTRAWLAGTEELALLGEESGLPQDTVIDAALSTLSSVVTLPDFAEESSGHA